MENLYDERVNALVRDNYQQIKWIFERAYISMMTDDYIGLDEKLQELEKQKEFDTSLYSFGFF